jgi:hypothetical protein
LDDCDAHNFHQTCHITMRLSLKAVTEVLDSAITCVPKKVNGWRLDAKLAKFHPGIRGRWEPPPSPVRPTPPEPVLPGVPEHTNHSNCSSSCCSIPDSLFLPTIDETPSLDLSYIVAQMDSALLAYVSAEDDIASILPYLADLPHIRHPEPLDRKPIDNIYRGWFGNFGSPVQYGRGTFDENGNPTCLTHWVAYKALESIVPGNKWSDWADYSADILNRQPNFDINGKPFDTNEHYLDTATPDQVDALKSTCVTHLMYVILHAYVNGYDSFDALVYGANPGDFWDPIVNKAYELATEYIVNHTPESESPRNFPLRVIKIIHFCAVIHGLTTNQASSMDEALTNFAHPDADAVAKPCTFFRTTDFSSHSSNRFWSSRSGMPYLVEFAIRLYGVRLQHIPLHELHQYVDIPPSLLRRIKSEMKDMVDNANNDAKNFQHRRRFVSNGEPGRIRIRLNTTPFIDRDMTLVDMLRWQGVKGGEASKKNAAKRKADGISAAPPQQVSNSDTSRPRKKKRTCEHFGCNKWVVTKGACIEHGRPRQRRTCKVPDCGNWSVRGGVCISHGADKRTCKVPGCENWVQRDGVCFRHGQKSRTGRM